MSWIDIVDESEADEKLNEVYDKISGDRGKVSDIMRIQSLKPGAMDAHLDLYMSVMFERSGLSRQEREVVATTVSVANDCPYCIEHHATALAAYWDAGRVDAFVADPVLFDDLDRRKRALVDYALQLTTRPSSLDESVIDILRDTGFGDEEILCLNLVASYFNFVNRIALGLGVETSPQEVGGYEY